jgi:cytidylate kinase
MRYANCCSDVSIVTIDGPSSSGKGTVARIVAKQIGLHHLDSGVLYRLIAWLFDQHGLDFNDDRVLSDVIDQQGLLRLLTMEGNTVVFAHQDITAEVRSETIGNLASQFAASAKFRSSILELQRGFAVKPGLVADGRDMGSIVFPYACCKVFLTAAQEVRAARRFAELKNLQLLDKSATMADTLLSISKRDTQDTERQVAPLKYDDSYLFIDSSDLDIEAVVKIVIDYYYERHLRADVVC